MKPSPPPQMAPDESPPCRTVTIDAMTVAVSGDVDAYSAPELAASLIDHRADRVILTAVTFIDAAGLRALLTAHRARPEGLTLISPSLCVLRLLDLAGHRATFRISTC